MSTSRMSLFGLMAGRASMRGAKTAAAISALWLAIGCGGSSTPTPGAATGGEGSAPTAVQPAGAGEAPQAEATKAPEPVPTGEEPTKQAEPSAAGAGDNAACNDLVSKVCAAAGDSSEGCNALKQAIVFLSARACTVAVEDLGDIKAKLAEMNKPCVDLVEKLCADLGPDTQTCKMVREKTPEFPTSRCTEMMGQYDQVIAELKRMEDMNKPLSAELQAKQTAGNVPSFGPADAKVTVVEYSDFECPFCSRSSDAVKQLKQKYGDRVRFVFRQFPLSFHPNAMPAAIASLEAHRQGKFWEVHDALFEKHRELSRENIEAIGQKAGLDMDALRKALDDKKYTDVIEADMELGKEVGVQGTPTMFINGERVQNPGDADAVSAIIDAQLAK